MYAIVTKVVSPAMISVQRFVPRSENLKKLRKIFPPSNEPDRDAPKCSNRELI
jgi:hypothetical protein